MRLHVFDLVSRILRRRLDVTARQLSGAGDDFPDDACAFGGLGGRASDRLVTDLLSDFVLRHGHSRVVMFGLVVDSADSDATRDCRTAAGSQHLP